MTPRRLFRALVQSTAAIASINAALARIEPAVYRGKDLNDPALAHLVSAELVFLDALATGAAVSDTTAAAVEYRRFLLRPANLRRALALGIPVFDLYYRQLVGWGRRPGTGEECLTLAIGSGHPFEVFDLLFIYASDPTRWDRLRRSEGVLTTDPVGLSLDGWPQGRRIRLFQQPIDWLRAGARPWSYCVLDWQSYQAHELLRGIDAGSIVPVCDSVAHAKALALRVRPRKSRLQLEVAA